MPSIPPATFASRLRSLSHREFVAFVADLWAAAGWETAAEQPVVRVRRNGTDRRLLVLPPGRFPRLRTAPDPGGPVDAVVTPRRTAGSLPRATPDAAVITADDLLDRLRYGVPAEDGEGLTREALGVPLRDDRWAEDDSLLAAVGGESGNGDSDGEETGTAGPVTRRTALGVLGAGAVGVGGALVGRRLASGGDDADDGPAQFDGDADADGVSTPSGSDGDSASGDDETGDGGGETGDSGDGAGTGSEREPSIDQPDVTFAFAYDDGQLTIRHDGGDPVPAGELLVRGGGLRTGPEYRWSRERRYGIDEPITSGDELSLSVDDDYDVVVIWDGDGDREAALAGDTGPHADEFGRVERPEASFAFEPDGDSLVVRHSGGDGIRAEHLRLRGGGFEGAPGLRWDADPDFDSESAVEPGDAITLDVDPERVAVNVIWDATDVAQFAPLPERLGGYRGPDRPLGTAGGVAARRIDDRNTGVLPDTSGPSPPLSPRWAFTLWNRPTTPALVVDGVVYVASDNRFLHALDATDGAELWRFDAVGESVDGLRVADGTAYVAAGSGTLSAVDAADGTEQWRHRLGQPVGSTPTVATAPDGTVEEIFVRTPPPWLSDLTETLHAIGPDGTEQWRAELGTVTSEGGAGRLKRGGPAVTGETVYASPTGSLVIAYDREDGTERWRAATDRSTHGALVVRGGLLYAVDEAGTVHAFDRDDGTERWRAALDAEVTTPPAVTEDSVLAGTADSITALDRTDGTEQWTERVGSTVLRPPVVAGDRLYAVSPRQLAAIDARDGTTQWTVESEPPIVGQPTVTAGTLYATVLEDDSGATLRALEPA